MPEKFEYTEDTPATPKSLVEQRRLLEQHTKGAIAALLKERESVRLHAEQRDKEIGEELKALGWKRPRLVKQIEEVVA